MKANAPEKIYLDEDESWHLTNPNGDSVEYIRTDVFIEKACEYWYQYNQDVVKGRVTGFTVDVEKFKRYLKGE